MPTPPRRPFQNSKGRKPDTNKSSGGATNAQGWDPVAAWYDKLVGESGSDYHRNVILPAALKMLDAKQGESVIDVCCGQGVLVKPLLDAGVGKFTGVDASPRLIEAAKTRHGTDRRASWIVADVCKPGTWADGGYDAATCLMAVHDVADVVAMFFNIMKSLKPGGRAVLVFMHPCFRIPRKTHWGWDGDQKIQFRRIDSYGTPLEIPITTHPGKGTDEQTVFYHRSLAELITSIGKGGLAVTACEELYSHRRSQGAGPFSKAEHKAAEEFPLFIALKAMKA
ncbi:MAG: class I SAM-dependent methyltransferase [Gloeobacteraceae cyanobacterium ES-bin-144]|nr:class I SAM-dependent methyltransferase [Verrucomicrobiales bacterium]